MYVIINNKKINIKILTNYFSKLIGLMFRKKTINDGYLFTRCNCIHTFFMKQNIDVCITDKNNKIIYLKENLNKNKVILPKKNGYYTYELPLNTVKYLKINEYLKTKER